MTGARGALWISRDLQARAHAGIPCRNRALRLNRLEQRSRARAVLRSGAPSSLRAPRSRLVLLLQSSAWCSSSNARGTSASAARRCAHLTAGRRVAPAVLELILGKLDNRANAARSGTGGQRLDPKSSRSKSWECPCSRECARPSRSAPPQERARRNSICFSCFVLADRRGARGVE